MAYIGSSLQTHLAYRLGETSATDDGNTKNQRYQWITDGYFEISRRKNWFWQEAAHIANTNTGSTTGYAEPTDLKEFIELKIDNIFYDLVPYNDNRIYTNTLGVASLPTEGRAYRFFRFGGRYYFPQTDANDAAVHYIKYYKRVTAIDDDDDTFLIPDEYANALVAYAEARYWLSITQQAKASVPFQEFEGIVKQMEAEHNRRGFGSNYGIMEPEDAEIFNT